MAVEKAVHEQHERNAVHVLELSECCVVFDSSAVTGATNSDANLVADVAHSQKWRLVTPALPSQASFSVASQSQEDIHLGEDRRFFYCSS